MSIIAQALLALIANAPQIIQETTAAYNAVKADLSETDQQAIDAALASAQLQDATATEAADKALSDAENR